MAGDVKRRNFSNELDRRKFIGVAAATAGAMLIKPELVRGTAANSAVRVGLLGCGGRGTEDASNLVDTGNARVAALADMFQDQLENAKKHFDEMQQGKGYQAIDASQIFVGPKAYQQMAASKEVDAVVIATPPYYHPQHLEAIVAGGKHVYLEKPVDRKITRLNSSHVAISYAVFCLKKKKQHYTNADGDPTITQGHARQ